MEIDKNSTLQKILEAAKREFLEKGFLSASLRNIVKEAGVTTGAFYGYYQSKEELFCALVDEPAKNILGKFREAQNTFANLPPQMQTEQMGKISGDCIDWMVEYIYEHFDAVKLLICSAEGTKYDQFIHTMVEIEIEGTHHFVQVLEQLGQKTKTIEEKLEHILVSGLFHGFFEIVRHDMPKKQAMQYVKELREFYTAGWKKIMGL